MTFKFIAINNFTMVKISQLDNASSIRFIIIVSFFNFSVFTCQIFVSSLSTLYYSMNFDYFIKNFNIVAVFGKEIFDFKSEFQELIAHQVSNLLLFPFLMLSPQLSKSLWRLFNILFHQKF